MEYKVRPTTMVFSRPAYIAIAGAVAIAFWIIFAVLDGLLFFSPILAFYVPADAVASFVLSNITAAMLGVVVAMNVYIFKNTAVRINGSFLSGSSMSMISSACVGCSSSGFFLATTFGGIGVAASSALSQFQLPLKIVSIALLAWAIYSANKRLGQSCALRPK